MVRGGSSRGTAKLLFLRPRSGRAVALLRRAARRGLQKQIGRSLTAVAERGEVLAAHVPMG